jgi:hypothetical protein
LASQYMRESWRRTTGAANASNLSKTRKKGDCNNFSVQPLLHNNDEHDNNNHDHHHPPETTKKLKCKKSKHAPTEVSLSQRNYIARGRLDLNSLEIGVTISANR